MAHAIRAGSFASEHPLIGTSGGMDEAIERGDNGRSEKNKELGKKG